jgi:hypothetical protein
MAERDLLVHYDEIGSTALHAFRLIRRNDAFAKRFDQFFERGAMGVFGRIAGGKILPNLGKISRIPREREGKKCNAGDEGVPAR